MKATPSSSQAIQAAVRPQDWLTGVLAIGRRVPGRPENGESLASLNDLAECSLDSLHRYETEGYDGRLKHVASDDVPRLLVEIVRLRSALAWISEYWLGPTAVCQVHVDHMKGIAKRALGWPYV